MATTTINANTPTDTVDIVAANAAEELTWSGRHPKSITLHAKLNAIRWDFVGPEGAKLSTPSDQDIVAGGFFRIPIRSGQARNLHRTSLFIDSATAGTEVGVQVEW